MDLDIQTGLIAGFIISIIGAILSLYFGYQSIKNGKKLLFFRKRRELVLRGWQLMFLSIVLGITAFLLRGYAEPVLYRYFPPSPTVTLTPTITLTPSITLSPTITYTPTITFTPAISYTPQLPEMIRTEITSMVTPNPNVVFSFPVIAKEIDDDYLPINPAEEFQNPVGKLYATFNYDKMIAESQWTAIWIRLQDQEIICYETKPWDGSTGGYGYSDCEPDPQEWYPGEYEVQLYVGETWIISEKFLVLGDAPTPVPTATATRTATATFTETATATRTVTRTVTTTKTPTITRTKTSTPTKTTTPTSSNTATITRTPRPTDTRWPSPTS